MGQNFLLDPALNRFIAESLGTTGKDLVLEIGPGLGFLTRELARSAGQVIAVELDGRLRDLLLSELAGMPAGERVELLQGDILGAGGGLNPAVSARLETALARIPGSRLLVGANLPYSIVGPCLAALVGSDRLAAAMVLMLQRELAERLAATPGSKAYGSLSVLLGSLYRVELLRRVGPEVFRPRPRVGSAIVRLVRLEPFNSAFVEAGARRAYARFLRQAFSARRKKLRSALAQAAATSGDDLDLAALGRHGDQRAGAIPVEEWPRLWREVCRGFP